MRLASDSPTPRIAQPAEGLYGSRDGLDYIDSMALTWRITMTPAVNLAYRVDAITAYGFDPRRLTTLSRSLGDGWTRAARRFGLTHVVLDTSSRVPDELRAPTDLALQGAQLAQQDSAMGLEVFAVPHRPWAFFAERALAFEQPQPAHQTLLELISRGDDDTVVVEAPAPPATAAGRVLHQERGAERISIDAEADGPALLVVQDAHWPGWTATIDGQSAEILIADILVRAVRWPPGRHHLEMVYDPPGVRLGWGLSAAGALLVLLLVARAAWRYRSRLPSSEVSPRGA
jgi:hypothetical protein